MSSKSPRASQAALGAAVRQLREDRGLQQKQLALESQLSPVRLSQIEAGDANPSWATIGRLATTLDVTVGTIADLADCLAPDS